MYLYPCFIIEIRNCSYSKCLLSHNCQDMREVLFFFAYSLYDIVKVLSWSIPLNICIISSHILAMLFLVHNFSGNTVVTSFAVYIVL